MINFHCSNTAFVEMPGDVYTVTVGDSLWNTFEFDNFSEALKKFNEVKGTGFYRAQLFLTRILVTDEVANNGNVDE